MKKKIKVVVSDFHLGNGRFLEDGTVNILEDFVYDNKFIEFVDHHAEQPAGTDVELIVNGDFFNMIQLMPEEMEMGLLTERASVTKTRHIIEGHRRVFDALRRFNRGTNRRISFLFGNHDPGLLWEGVKEVIRATIDGEVKFYDDVYRFDGVHIEHGHQLEPIFEFDKRRYFLTKGQREPMLNLPWGVFFVTEYLFRIKRKRPYIDKIKPYGLYYRWSLLNDFWYAVYNLIRYVSFILGSRFSRFPLRRKLAFKGFAAAWALSRSPTLESEVRKIFEREPCRIVILGHTHITVHKKLGPDREYLNPGSWNDVTSLSLESLGHSRHLIYVMIEYHDGKPFARLLEWFGQHRLYDEIRV